MNANTQEAEEPQTIEEEASNTFVLRLQGKWTEADQAALEARLERDPAFADAYRRVEESWDVLDGYAEMPEVVSRRERSLAYARRSSARRWVTNRSSGGRWRFAVIAVGLAALLVTAWQFSPYGYRSGLYQTGTGEQRLLDLEDHSRIALDAKTRLQVRYTQDARIVQLQEGQAQFSVAKDPTRPFKVQAGDRTIVALGTVFTVEYVDHKVHVAMMEGRVAVVDSSSRESAERQGEAAQPESATSGSSPDRRRPSPSNADDLGVELTAGEELRVGHDGRATVVAHADLEAATAWREGKVIFRGERLSDAVRRLNRYSRLQIEIQGSALAEREISGVFEAGDTQGFVNALQRYGPVSTEYVGTRTVLLRVN